MMTRICSSLLFLALTAISLTAFATTPPEEPPAIKYYTYAHNDAEYSVKLPEAPTVETIWATTEYASYLGTTPADNTRLGEIATLKRVDLNTDDLFDVKITFLKVTDQFLRGLSEGVIKKSVASELKDVSLTHESFNMSSSPGGLKWATMTGFSVNKNNQPLFNAVHYLTGLQSILVVRVAYSPQNDLFKDYYKTLVDSISYHPL